MDCPLSAGKDGVIIKPEIMTRERLYHCIFKGRAMLVFKDSQDVLNCYEIEEPALVEQISSCTDDEELEGILEDYIRTKGS